MRSLETRRAATLVLFLLITGAGVLAHGPFGLGALRLAGVSLLWWYVAVVAPLVGAAVVVAAFLARRS
jgi:hypothetical protein